MSEVYNKSKELYDARSAKAEATYEWLESLDALDVGQFAEAISGEFGRGMAERYGSLVIKHGLWSEVLALALSDDDKLAFRSAWSLDWAYFQGRERMRPYAGSFLDTYLASTNGSVHRSFSKVLCDMMRRGIICLTDDQAASVAEKCFDLLIRDDVKSAVKVWCAEILYELSATLDWIGDHLADTLRHQMETQPTPAILNHYAKLLRRLG